MNLLSWGEGEGGGEDVLDVKGYGISGHLTYICSHLGGQESKLAPGVGLKDQNRLSQGCKAELGASARVKSIGAQAFGPLVYD